MLDPHLVRASHGHVHQVDVVADLMHGNYEPVTTVAEAFTGSNLGLGVADRLDGEIISIDGLTWRIPASGVPEAAEPNLGLPFAVSAIGGIPFQQSLESNITDQEIGLIIEDFVKSANNGAHSVAAIRIDGTFRDVLLRSEHKQDPPFLPLNEVLRHEVQFPFDSWSGTLAGFAFPQQSGSTATSGATISGLHLHGLSFDRTSGGHVHHATTIQATLNLWLDDADITIPYSRISHAIKLLEHVMENGTPTQRSKSEYLIDHLVSDQSTPADFTAAIALHDAYLHDPYLEKN